MINITSCHVLSASIYALISPLSKVLNQLYGRIVLSNVELIYVDNGQFVVVRMTKEPLDKDREKLLSFVDEYENNVIVQGNEGELLVFKGHKKLPFYTLNGEVKLSFTPGNFVQINGEINKAMVEQAVQWLDIKADELVLDLFYGVGNFSLPLAKSSAEVIGVESVPEMLAQDKVNAKHIGLFGVTFTHTYLSADLSKESWLGKLYKLLLDHSRAGVFESLQWLKKMKPKSILYVSCDP